MGYLCLYLPFIYERTELKESLRFIGTSSAQTATTNPRLSILRQLISSCLGFVNLEHITDIGQGSIDLQYASST
jgi:hypothetical protein